MASSNIEYDSLNESGPIYIEVETTQELEEAIERTNEQEMLNSKKENKRSNVRKVPSKKDDQQKRDDFEALYEEVFAVQLPSQLW